MEEFEMKIVRKDGITKFEVNFGKKPVNATISKFSSNDKKQIKKYLKKFF